MKRKKLTPEERAERTIVRKLQSKGAKPKMQDLPPNLIGNLAGIVSIGQAMSTTVALGGINLKLNRILRLLRDKKRS